MEYIVHRRFRARTLSGDVNLPALTRLDCEDNLISHAGAPLCYATSENAHQYLARNDDGNGLLRGRLTQAIQKRLKKRDRQYQERWDRVWNDAQCRACKRAEYDDYWLWNHEFFNADIDVLRHIANLVGAKEGA